MNESSTNTEETGWTKENLQKLISAIKNSIPEEGKGVKYTEGLKHLDWEKVAFPPYSSKACKQKWINMLHKMRKIRSLMELINEAEDVISKPKINHKIHPEMPKKPSPPNALYYEENHAALRKQHPHLRSSQLLKMALKQFSDLPPEDKVYYVNRFKLAKKEYIKRMTQFRIDYNSEPETQKKRRKDLPTDSSDSEEDTRNGDELSSEPPTSAFELFCKEQKSRRAGVSGKVNDSVWAQLWHDLSRSGKRKYAARLKELKMQHMKKQHRNQTTSNGENNGRNMRRASQRITKANSKGDEGSSVTDDSEDVVLVESSSEEQNLLDLNEDEEEDLGLNVIIKDEDFFLMES